MDALVCARCRRPLGRTIGRPMMRVWCSTCTDHPLDIPYVSKNEPRDHLIVSAAFAGVSLTAIATRLDLTRQRVSAIHQDRTRSNHA